jgi:hypothetical protein
MHNDIIDRVLSQSFHYRSRPVRHDDRRRRMSLVFTTTNRANLHSILSVTFYIPIPLLRRVVQRPAATTISNNMSGASAAPLSLSALEQAVTLLLQNSFDADSQQTLLVLIKILDNIIAKPGNSKVRTLNPSNPTIQAKLLSRRGGLECLRACGFAVVSTSTTTFGSSNNNAEQLELRQENTAHLQAARRLFAVKLVRELNMAPSQLPVPTQPPPALMVNSNIDCVTKTANPTSSLQQQSISSGTFNPYAGHYFDAKAHVTGVAAVRPTDSYVSPAEARLQQLQQHQQELLRHQQSATIDRAWVALRPGQEVSSLLLRPSVSSATATDAAANSTSSATDSYLIAHRLKQQQIAVKEREQFSTKAMRDVKALERQKVYARATLTIQFSNGMKLVGQCLPTETVGALKQVLRRECFGAAVNHVAEDADGDVDMDHRGSATDDDFDLFVAPPRRVLKDERTLQEEGLVPAAKIFCTATRALRDDLFQQRSEVSPVVQFPVGQAVAAIAPPDMLPGPATTKKENAATKKLSREEALLQRMMGGNSKMGTTAGSSKSDNGTDKKSAPKKPKWFG